MPLNMVMAKINPLIYFPFLIWSHNLYSILWYVSFRDKSKEKEKKLKIRDFLGCLIEKEKKKKG